MDKLSGIRVTYSGLINFVIGLIRIFTGFAFLLILTRLLTPEEFGTWKLIIGLIVYVMVLHPIVSFWVTREVSRGITSGKTAVLSSGLFSAIGMIIYIGIAYFVAAETPVEQNILFLSIAIIPTQLFYHVLSAINLGWKPQATSYGLIIMELVKIPTILIFLYYFEMGIEGVIFSVIIGNIISAAALAIISRNKIRGSININFLKNWLKRSWLVAFPSTNSIIYALDVLVFTIIIGSTEGVGYYSAALILGNLASYASLISSGVYPKLLGDNDRGYLKRIFTRFLFFLIPLGIISIAFARPGLYAFNPLYETVYIATIFLTFKIILFTISEIFSDFLKGIEQVDTKDSSFRDYIKSKLFFIPTIKFIQYSTYIGSLSAILVLLHSSTVTNLVIYWSIISCIIHIPLFVILSIHVKKNLDLKLEYLSILKYLLSGITSFGISYLLAEKYLVYTSRLFDFLPNLLLFVVLGIGIYLFLTYVLDKNTKQLFKSIFSEIRK